MNQAQEIANFLAEAMPCPFCGSQDLTTTDRWDDEGEYLAIACKGCKAEAPATTWNQRIITRQAINA